MSLLALARTLFALPPRRFRCDHETAWVAMPDGVRLATTVFRPLGRSPGPAVVMRTPYGAQAWPPSIALLARLFAEAGHATVVQDVRGRYGSEGRFTPFANEAEDGVHTLEWVAEQPWCDGTLALVGFSYLGYASWAAQARAPERVRALVVGIGASDPWATFHPGGAFALETALRWSAGVGEREGIPERQLDLARGFAFRPVREADRVAIAKRPFFRDWLDHPRPDEYWQPMIPKLGQTPAPLLVGGWYDILLGPQLADWARTTGDARLVIGPWSHGRYVRRKPSPRSRWFGHVAIREILAFLDRELGEEGDPPASAVRLFPLGGEDWLDVADWPVPDASERVFHLRSQGGANGSGGDGRLDPEAPGASEAPDRFTYDPSDPVPSAGGAMLGPGGAVDQRPVESRHDVLCYTSDALPSDLLLAGPVRVDLFAATSAPDTDFTAKLVDVAPDGPAINLCEGVSRMRWRKGGLDPVWLEPEEPVRVEIDLWGTCARIARGHRLRLEISSSSFPRYDRNPNTRDATGHAAGGVPARQTVLHDSQHASKLVVAALPA